MQHEILNAFVDHLIGKIESQVEAIIWFGSTARGDETDDSDIDLLVLSDEEELDVRDMAFDIAADLSLEYDCLIGVLIMSKKRYEEMKNLDRLLIKNIEKDGIYLWQKAA